MEVIIVIGSIIWIIMNVAIAREKNRSVGGIIGFSIFCSPLMGYLYLLAVPVKHKGPEEKNN